MSGLVTAGVLLCGVHIANAQTNIDTGYTITIPSEVGIDKDSGKGNVIKLRDDEPSGYYCLDGIFI